MPKVKSLYQWYTRKEEKRFSFNEYKTPRYHKFASYNKGVFVLQYWLHTDNPLSSTFERKVKSVLDKHLNSTGMGICVAEKQKSSRIENRRYFCRLEYYARLNHLPTVEEMREMENLIIQTSKDCEVEGIQE